MFFFFSLPPPPRRLPQLEVHLSTQFLMTCCNPVANTHLRDGSQFTIPISAALDTYPAYPRGGPMSEPRRGIKKKRPDERWNSAQLTSAVRPSLKLSPSMEISRNVRKLWAQLLTRFRFEFARSLKVTPCPPTSSHTRAVRPLLV